MVMTTDRLARAIALALLVALLMPGGALAAAPEAHNDATTVQEDASPTTIDVLANDVDDDENALTIVDATQPAHGTVEVADDSRSLTYEPDADFDGDDTFEYTITDGSDTDTAGVGVTITAVDDPPVAVSDDITIHEDSETLLLDVVDNDTDVDGGGMHVTQVTASTKGTTGIELAYGFSVTYRPDLNATGTDAFDYTLNGGSVATVSITILPVDDSPQAIDDTFVIGEDASIQTLDVLLNDTDIDGGTKEVTAVGSATKGTASIAPGSGAVTYLPGADAYGDDSFTYTVNGVSTATVHVEISPSNDDPVALPDSLSLPANALAVDVHALANDSDVDGDTLTITAKTNPSKGMVVIGGGGTTITYRPFHELSGTDSFTYTVSDGHGATAVGAVSVVITTDNRAPNAVNDSLHVPQGAGPRSLTVLANDQDLDGNNLTIKTKTNGTHGTVVITGGGTGLTYNPVNSYHGIDTFKYTISDGLVSDTATVLVTVDRDRTAPVVVAPKERLPGHTVGRLTTKVRLGWSAKDPGSGVKRYKLQVSVDGGGWKTIALPKATTKAIDRTLKTGHTYRFRVRATDGMGNVSAYVKSPILKAVRYSEESGMLGYVGVWAKTTTTKALGGATRHATSSAKRARFAFTGYDVGWIATTATSSGKARIYLDGALVATIDLDRAKTAYRKLVFSRHFATLAAHDLEIQPVGDGRVDVDGFVVLR
jgi:hypothetical protein